MCNEQPQNEKKTIASKRLKYLGIGLTKEVQAYTLKTIKHCSKKLKA